MRDKNTFAAEGRAAVVLQRVVREGRAALWLAARAGGARGEVPSRPGRREGGQPHGVSQTRGPFVRSLTQRLLAGASRA